MKNFLKYLIPSAILCSAAISYAAGYQFNNNLYPGLKNNPEVMKMQDLLRSLGFFTLPISSGNYFAVTADSVKKFQLANSIKPINGNFGPLTRAQANRLSGVISNVVVPPVNQNAIVDKNATSTYYGRIKIDYAIKYEGVKPENEYIVLRNISPYDKKGDVDITGLRLVNANREEFIIPRGHNIPGMSPVAKDEILIPMYSTAKIITGRQDKLMNFRENLCVGYLDETSNFNDMLTKNCPRPEFRKSTNNLPEHCVKVFDSTKACRMVDYGRIGLAECITFADAHLNYQGCVADNKSREDFYGSNWLIWMQRPMRFMRDLHDTITLYDQLGKVVDVYSY